MDGAERAEAGDEGAFEETAEVGLPAVGPAVVDCWFCMLSREERCCGGGLGIGVNVVVLWMVGKFNR